MSSGRVLDPKKPTFRNSGYGPNLGVPGADFGRILQSEVAAVGRNEIPAGSGSFMDPLGGIRRILGSPRANFPELVPNSTFLDAGDPILVHLVKWRSR